MKEINALKTKKILIVDDDECITSMITDNLAANGIENVCSLNNPTLVLNELKSSKASKLFDILIIDYIMPSLSGAEVISQIRSDKSYDSLMILTITGNSPSLLVEKMLNIGATDFLSKPFTSAALLRKLESLLKTSYQQENEISFLPVRMSTFSAGDKLSFDLYHFEYNKYRLMLKEQDTLEEQHLALLNKYNVKKLFIEDRVELRYQFFLDLKIENLINQSENTIKEKGEILSNFGSRVIKDVFNDPTEKKIHSLGKVKDILKVHVKTHKIEGLESIISADQKPSIYKHCLNVTSIAMIILNKIIELEEDIKHKNHQLSKPFAGMFDKNKDTQNFDILILASLIHDLGHSDSRDDPTGSHVEIGVSKLKELHSIHTKVIEIIAQHEEFCDGSGKPNGLKARNMSNLSKILSIANFYEEEVLQKELSRPEFFQIMKKNEEKFMKQLIEILKLVTL